MHTKDSAHRRPVRSLRRIWLTGAAATLLAVPMWSASTASGASTLIDTNPCNENALSQPFARWGDSSYYELAPGGDIEGSLSGWTLSGGASVVTGSEPFGATGEVGKRSLSLPAGSSVQTPFTCVDAAYPTIRFFAEGSSILSSVLVQVLYKEAGLTVAVPAGIVALDTQWAPSLKGLTGSLALALTSGGTAQMAIRFTALTGTSRVDDIFLDPRMH